MISVDVTSALAGTYLNETGSVTSSLGASAPAAAMLTVDATDAPGFARVFAPDTIRQGGETQIVFTVDNRANAIGMTGMAFDDALPAGVSVAATPGAGNSCGGAFSPSAGDTVLALTGGALAAGATCEIRVTVRAITAGTLTGPDVALTSSVATATAAEATLDVTAADAPGFTKAFSPDTVDRGGVSTLTFTIDNGANLIDVGSLAFTDNFPVGLIVAATPNTNNTCGGTFNPAAADTALTFVGGSVAAGQACTLSVDVQALRAGTLDTVSGDLSSDLPVTTPGASAMLTVNEAPLTASMAFDPATIAQGGVSTLSYTLNNGALVEATSVALEDTLPADVVLAATANAQTTCTGGALNAAAGGDTITFTGGALAAGETCAISVDVTSVLAGTYLNETGSVTSSLGASAPAAATLTVDVVDAPDFAKAFSPDTVDPGGISTLTFTIDNTVNGVAVGALAFTDTFPNGLIVAATPNTNNTCGGTFNPAAADTALTFVGGSVEAGQACTLSVDVQALRAGALETISGDLISDLPITTPGASAMLTVNEAPLTASMAFDPDTIAQGGVSTLSYTLNNGALVEATSVALEDTLPADVVLAATANAQTTCTGGALNAAAGGDTITFTGGALAAGATCAISVDVTSALAGTYLNETGSVTSSLGASAPAAATLTVDVVDAPDFAKAFSPDTVDPGGISTLTFTIDNTVNGVAVGALAFTDTFPNGLIVAATPNTNNTCGGTFNPAAADTALTFVGGSVAAGQACTLSVDVQALRAGALETISGDLTSDLPVTTPGASATLTVNEAPLTASMAFDPDTIAQGEVLTLSYTLNNGALVEATSVSLEDTLPANVTVAATPNAETTCTGGALNAAAGGDTITFTGGALAAGATCAISVDVTSALAGTYRNETGSVTSSLGASAPAAATLTVDAADAPDFAKAFSPDTVDPGGISTLTFTIDNTVNAIDVGSLAFTDNFPDGLIVAATPAVQNTCGGAFAPAASDNALAFTGGSVDAGQACTLSVDVQALRAGALETISGDLSSDLPVTTPGVSAMLTVNEAPLTASMAFDPDTIAQGEVSTLGYTLNNSAAVEATSVALEDTLPADVVLAADPDASTTCGGALTAGAGGDTITFTGGALAAGATCTLAVDVTSALVGTYLNETGSVTSSLGASAPAAATLTVDAADAPDFAKAFSPDTVDPGGISTLTFTIDNAINAIDVGSLAFTDNFPDGLIVAATPAVQNTCGGAFAPAASDNALAFTGGSVEAGQACTLSVDVQALRAGALETISGDLISDLPITTPGASAMLTVNEAPLTASMAFDPDTIAQGEVSTLGYTLNNSAAVGATSVALEDTLPANVVLAADPDASTTCGGALTAGAGGDTITFTGGALAAGATCTLAVDVTSALVGTYPNETGSVTSSLGTSAPAEATLTVEVAPLTAFMVSATKTTDRGTAVFGETVNFVMSFTSQSALMIANGRIVDLLPSGMIYTPGSARVAGTPVEPLVDGRRLEWRSDLASGQTIEVHIAARVIRSGRFGTLTNRTLLEDRFGRMVSNIAEVGVRIDPEHIFDCSDVIGRVFHDRNGNGYQDGPGSPANPAIKGRTLSALAEREDRTEAGLPGVRLVTPDGILITTDEFGRYSLPCASLPRKIGSNFMLKLDPHTLPPGFRVTTENPRVVRLTAGKFARINFGVRQVRVVDIDVTAQSFTGATTTPVAELTSAVDRLIKQLRDNAPLLRLSYALSANETPALARARLQAIEDMIRARWRRQGAGRPAIEKTIAKTR